MPRRAWVWRSMKPGATTLPPASITRAAGASIRGAILAIVSPRTARSPRYQGLPVPSMILPLRTRRSNAAPGCACAPAMRPVSSAATAHAARKALGMRQSVAEQRNHEFGIENSSARRRGLRRFLGQQTLDERGHLVDGLLVELAAGLAGEAGVGAAHPSIASEEERGRERVEVDALRDLRVEILRLARQQHRVLHAVLLDERADANRILQLRVFLQRQLADLHAGALVLLLHSADTGRVIVA